MSDEMPEYMPYIDCQKEWERHKNNDMYMQERMPERMSHRMSGIIPDRMPESPSEYILIIFLMPDAMSETMSDWLVKVGITRNKVIILRLFAPYACWMPWVGQ